MRYGYFTRIYPMQEIPAIKDEDDFRPPIEDYFSILYGITALDKVIYDTVPNRLHLKQLIDEIRNKNETYEIHMLSLYDIGRYAKHITQFLLNLPSNVDLFLFDDKVNVRATISYICEKYDSIYDLVRPNDYVRIF